MATIYIDPTGANGNGSFATPYNTWASVTFVAGNTYLQKEGTTFRGQITIAVTGTIYNRIMLGVYDAVTGLQAMNGSKRAFIDANGAQFGVLGSGSTGYFTVMGFDVSNTRHASASTGLRCGQTANGVWFLYCNVHNVYNTPITANGAVGIKAFCHTAKIIGCRIWDCGEDGIYAEGNYLEIAENTIFDISKGTVNGDCIQLSDSLVTTNNYFIHDNDLNHTNADCKGGIITVMTTPSTSRGGLIKRNRIMGFVNSSADTSNNNKGMVLGSANVQVSGNYIAGGVRLIDADSNTAGLRVYGNVFGQPNTSCTSFGVVYSAADSQVFNNFFIKQNGRPYTSNAVHQGASVASCLVKNNIMMGFTNGMRVDVTNLPAEAYNIFYQNGVDIIDNNGAAVTIDATSTTGVRPNTNLQGVPLAPLATGVYVGLYTDNIGSFYKILPMIGAYEYQTTRATR